MLQIQRPETELSKLGVPINGTYKHMNDGMSSSCTLPSGKCTLPFSTNFAVSSYNLLCLTIQGSLKENM